MDNIKKLIIDNKLNKLYSYNSYSLKSICNYLNIWDNYTDLEKIKLENLTKNDSIINRNFYYDGIYDNKFNYIETQRNSIEKIYSKILEHKNIDNKDIFLDIGSGNGKLLIHLSIISNIETLIGVEIIKERNLYSKKIYEEMDLDKSIFFFNKDLKDFDISISSIIFMNNLYFDDNDIQYILDNIKDGTHVLSFIELDELKILKDIFTIETSLGLHKLFYYIK